MTAMSYGGVPGVAVLGGDLSQLRRRAGRWRLRDWRLRTKLTVLLLVPLLLAGVLGAVRVSDAMGEAQQLRAVAQHLAVAERVGLAVAQLQQERDLAVSDVLGANLTGGVSLFDQMREVDHAIAGLQSAEVLALTGLGSADAAAGAGVETRETTPRAQAPLVAAHRAVTSRISDLPALRQQVLGDGSPQARADAAVSGYTGIIAALLNFERELFAAGGALPNEAAALTTLAVAREQAGYQHAVLLAALVTGSLSEEQQSVLRTTEARFDAAIADFGEVATPEQWQLYSETVTGQQVLDRETLLGSVLAGASRAEPPEVAPQEWHVAATGTVERIGQVEANLLNQLLNDAATRSEQAWNAMVRDAVVVGALLVLAVVLLLLVLRSLLVPLRALRSTAFDVADRRLPEVVEKLRVTDGKVGETVVDPVPVYSREEIGQLARAFDTVHVQAVRLAAEQAMLRSTINDLFLNLAGRSQRLVERQLTLIDKLESGEHDPEQLDNLFQLDHLALRMRRNSENLVVLAGGELPRGAQRQMSVLDMLRAAVAEIAEYRRVSLRRVAEATVAGPAAGDLVHLIAELLDNAANAAASDTPITVTSALTEDNGLMVEITDCGPGLPPGELHAINERLASSPACDSSVSHQMGLFVVSRLAARHQIRVRLRQPRGDFGITASVLVPSHLISTGVAVPTDLLEGHRPRRGSGPAGGIGPSGIGPSNADSSATSWAAQPDADLPMQVSVLDGPIDRDLFSPSSIGNLALPHRVRQSPRSAAAEWHDLFGGAGSHPSTGFQPGEPVQQPVQPAEPVVSGPGAEAGDPARPAAAVPAESLGSAAEPVPGPVQPPAPAPAPAKPGPAAEGRFGGATPKPFLPPLSTDVDELASPPQPGSPEVPDSRGEVREEIFEQVSAWFRERRSETTPAPASATAPASAPASAPATVGSVTDTQEWRSAADVGWQAANALRKPVDFGVTAAGLPRRRPRAHLVPGGAAEPTDVPAAATANGPARTADDVRGRLSSYQRGLMHGRHARLGPDDESTPATQ